LALHGFSVSWLYSKSITMNWLSKNTKSTYCSAPTGTILHRLTDKSDFDKTMKTLKIQIAESEPLRYNFAPLIDSQIPTVGLAIIFT